MSIDKLDLEQRVGIFQVPDFVEEDMSVKNWRREKRPLFEEIPLVVEEEIYSKAGVVSKLRLNFRSCEKFEKKYGLLRLKKDFNSGGKKISPYGTLSIAQFTSFLFNEPIENILFSENYFKKKSFLEKNAQERVRILFNSYFGCSWFNSFYKKQKRLAELVDPPKVKIWQRISVKNLEDWFISTNDKGGFVGKLRKKGFSAKIIEE